MYIPIMILWYCIAFLISTIENGKNLGEAMIYIEALVFVYWYSGKISLLGRDMEIYENMRTEKNPLYVQGHFRKKFKSHTMDTFFQDLKVFYFSQIQAIIQILLLLIWGISSFFTYKWNDAIWIIGAWCIGTGVIQLIAGQYYRRILLSPAKKSLHSGIKWNLFTNPGIAKATPVVPLGYGFDSFWEVAEHLGKNLKETGYKFQDKKHISDDGKVWFYTNKTEKYLKVFVLVKVNQLEKKQCKELDDVTEAFLNENLGKKKEDFSYSVRCICLVCAEQISLPYRNFVMNAVHQRRRLYYLPAGICFEEGEFEIAEIEMDQLRGVPHEQYESMREEFLSLVDYEQKLSFSGHLKRFKKMKSHAKAQGAGKDVWKRYE